MKLTVCMIVLTTVVVLVRGEGCQSPNDCQHVTCPERDFTKDCANNLCTCTQNNSKCVLQSDCSHAGCQTEMHCVDGQCRCDHHGGHMPPPVGK